MDRDTFIVVMRRAHDALFKLHAPADKNELQVLNELVNAYISMIAGFHQWLYEDLRVFLVAHPEVTDDEIGELYDALTIAPEYENQ